MTVPEELVQAGAEAIKRDLALFRSPDYFGTELADGEYEDVARRVLQAAFAKLPECEEAVEAVSRADCIHRGNFWNGGCYQTKVRTHPECALDAIAREIGGES